MASPRPTIIHDFIAGGNEAGGETLCFPPGKSPSHTPLTHTLCQVLSSWMTVCLCQVWRLASPHRQSNPVGRINLHPGQGKGNERLWNAAYVRFWREGKSRVASEWNRRMNGWGIREYWGMYYDMWMDSNVGGNLG